MKMQRLKSIGLLLVSLALAATFTPARAAASVYQDVVKPLALSCVRFALAPIQAYYMGNLVCRATLGQNGKVTLLDWAKSLDPDGSVATVAELLSQTNEVLLDMPMIEGNLPTGHKHTIRTGMPTSIWRQM